MDTRLLNSDNWRVYKTFLKFKKEANLTFNQYLVLIELHSVEAQGDCTTYKDIREKFEKDFDPSDFNKTVMGPLNRKGLAYGEQKKAPQKKDVFITKKGRDLVEKVLGTKK